MNLCDVKNGYMLNEPVSKNELLTIFEETQMDKDLEDDGDI